MINEILIIAFVPLLFGAFETNSFQSTFCNIQILGIPDLIQCDQLKDTLILEEGTNITLTMNNVTDTITIDAAGGDEPIQNYCGGTDKFSAYNATTNSFICTTDDTGLTGEANTVSNLSPGEGLFTTKAGVDLPFKSIAAGSNISLSSNATTIEINAAGGLGEANTVTDQGFGENIVLPKVGVDIPIKGLAVSGDLGISSNATDITISYTDPIASGAIIDTTTCNVGDFVTAVNNSTGVVTCTTADIPLLDTTSCTTGDFIESINNSTGVVTCGTPSGSVSYPDIAVVSNTDVTTNVNQAAWTVVPITGTTIFLDAASFSINGNGIECEYNGRVKISSSIYFFENALARAAPQSQHFINGVGQGEIASMGYIRDSGGHDHASLQLVTFGTCVANQVVDVRTRAEAASTHTDMEVVGSSTLILERFS